MQAALFCLKMVVSFSDNSLASMTLNKLIQQLLHEFIAHETDRVRRRSAQAHDNLLRSIAHLIAQAWQAEESTSAASIHLHKNRYSGRYGLTHLSYEQTVSAYRGLKSLGYIREIRRGYFDRSGAGSSNVTNYVATDKLLALLKDTDEDPFKSFKLNLNQESIILRDKVNGARNEINYDDTDVTITMRMNVRIINECLTRHWPDLQITDTDYVALQERLQISKDKSPVNFANRILRRVFTMGSFEKGGRFYGGWWQNIPSELRRYITIDSKRTCELDYSQLNPHMIYSLAGKDMGSDDAYTRVFGEKHRDLVKEAFNAMMQAETVLRAKPRDIDLHNKPFSWKELKLAILEAHKPIADMFFTGIGNTLQFKDSQIAEQIMLHYAHNDVPVLPVHDSFIMHHAYGDTFYNNISELEEQMRKAYRHVMGTEITVKGEVFEIVKTSFDGKELEDLSIEEIASGPPEYSRWNRRNR